jgi:hypothetical protein
MQPLRTPRRLRLIRAGLVSLAAVAAGAGCAPGPGLRPEPDRMSPLVTATGGQAGVRDLRPAFRAQVCARLRGTDDPPCDAVLTRMGGEGPVEEAPFPGVYEQSRRYRIGIVPGFFAECLDDAYRPFAAAQRDLQSQGFEVVYLRTTGRGSVATNGEMLARQLSALPDDPRPFILFGYSKGMPDLLEMLVRFPDAARRVAAVVGVAGAVYGSPLAERYEALWKATLMSLPLGNCAAGEGEGVHDMRKDVRVAWWKAHGGEIRTPMYSIVGLPERKRVSPIMAAIHSQLSDIDPRNDAQVLWTEAVGVPGALLGYVNADHWALAMRLSEAFPTLADSFVDDLPRGAMLGAAIAVVVRDLEAMR